jgi:cell division protein FtsQ
VNETGGYKYRQKKSIAMYSLVASLLILLISVFGVGVLFRVTNIVVEGQSRYGAGEIIRASGLSRGDSLSLSDKGAAARRISEALPYIVEVKILTRMPGTIILQIRESREIAFISSGDSGLIIDKDCRILELTGSGDKRGLVSVLGLQPSAPAVGKKLAAPAEQETALAYLKIILNALSANGIEAESDLLDISNISNISFRFRELFTVELGSGLDASQKISTMLSFISQAEPGAKYEIRVKDPSMTTLIKIG